MHCSDFTSTVVVTRWPPRARAPPQFLEPVLARKERLNSSGTQYQRNPVISPMLSSVLSVLLNEVFSKLCILVLLTCVLFTCWHASDLVLQRSSCDFKVKVPQTNLPTVVHWHVFRILLVCWTRPIAGSIKSSATFIPAKGSNYIVWPLL